MNKKIIYLLLAVAVVVGLALFWLYHERIFSNDVLSLEISGAKKAYLGDEVEYTVKYKNTGNFVLENARIVFNLPEHSLNEDGKKRYVENLNDIHPGQGGLVKFKGVLIGKEDEVQTARAVISYTPKNLSSRYEVAADFSTTINSVPIILDFDLPLKIEQQKQFTYTINYVSSVDYPLENLSIKVQPPTGFEFKSSDPESIDDREWKLETLEKEESGKIAITGALNVSPQGNLPFSMQLGMWQDGNFIVIKEAQKEIQVLEPPLRVSQQINGAFEYTANTGEMLRYEIIIKNTGAESLGNVVLTNRLQGSVFDFSTLSSQEGEVRPGGVIVFDSGRISRLQGLSPNNEARIEFNVVLKQAAQLSEAEKDNPTIKNSVEAQGIFQDFITKVNVVEQSPGIIELNFGN
ncbi:MAG: hypothetical protein Q7S10_02090 [bacterium]|nr:hypothetical protein [bacterium]